MRRSRRISRKVGRKSNRKSRRNNTLRRTTRKNTRRVSRRRIRGGASVSAEKIIESGIKLKTAILQYKNIVNEEFNGPVPESVILYGNDMMSAVQSHEDDVTAGLIGYMRKSRSRRSRRPVVLASFLPDALDTVEVSQGSPPAPAPGNAAPDPGQDDGNQFMAVICPDGVGPGDIVIVQLPNGQDVETEVPGEISPGDTFEVEYDAA